MNLKEHYKSAIDGPTPIREASLGGFLSGTASTIGDMASYVSKSSVGQAASALVGGKEGVKRAFITQGLHVLTGLDPSDVEKYYDKIKGTPAGGLALKIKKSLKTQGINDFDAIQDNDFVAEVGKSIEDIGGELLSLINKSTDLFSLHVYAISKFWDQRTISSSGKSKTVELSKSSRDINGFFKFEGKVKAALENKFKRHSVQFVAGTQAETPLSNALAQNSTATLAPDEFETKTSGMYIASVIDFSLFDIQHKDPSNMVGITFTVRKFAELYNVLATLQQAP